MFVIGFDLVGEDVIGIGGKVLVKVVDDFGKEGLVNKVVFVVDDMVMYV